MKEKQRKQKEEELQKKLQKDLVSTWSDDDEVTAYSKLCDAAFNFQYTKG